MLPADPLFQFKSYLSPGVIPITVTSLLLKTTMVHYSDFDFAADGDKIIKRGR